VMTKLGRWLYAVGGSESAARLAGVPVRSLKMVVYALNGALVGLAAALLLLQLTSAQAQMGSGLELTAIAAVAIGGTPLAGGRGSVGGTLLGVLLIGLIGNSLNLLSISSDWQYVLQGAVIVIAVMAQRD
jgi:ribose transport system permease protein